MTAKDERRALQVTTARSLRDAGLSLIQIKEKMGIKDQMMFPDKWEDFAEQYSFKDNDEAYTDGEMLIPVARVHQMMEHYFDLQVERNQMLTDKCEAFIDEYYKYKYGGNDK
jgi:hypothetical protein